MVGACIIGSASRYLRAAWMPCEKAGRCPVHLGGAVSSMAVSKTADAGAIPARGADMAVRVSVPPFSISLDSVYNGC